MKKKLIFNTETVMVQTLSPVSLVNSLGGRMGVGVFQLKPYELDVNDLGIEFTYQGTRIVIGWSNIAALTWTPNNSGDPRGKEG